MAVKFKKDTQNKNELNVNMTAQGRFDALNNERSSFLRKCEKFAKVTVPRVCTEDNYDQNNYNLQYSYDSVGSRAALNLTNKIMVALFNPSNPFFKLQATDDMYEEASKSGIDQVKIDSMLSSVERKCLDLLEEKALRPTFIEVILHLIITGNCLLIADTKENISMLPIKSYVVRRSNTGKVIELITREKCRASELLIDVQNEVKNREGDDKVILYKWIKLDEEGKGYDLEQWVDDQKMSEKFSGYYKDQDFPYHALTWSLAQAQHYGTGHVEENYGDLWALRGMSKGLFEGSVLATEIKYLVKPTGTTKVEDLQYSQNGDAIPGEEGDVTTIQPQNLQALNIQRTIIQDYIQRVSSSFLMSTPRNAERVTATEIRDQAYELETSLGGVYSRIASDFQKPIAYYLLKNVKSLNYSNKYYKPIVVTGLDALTKADEADKITLLLNKIAGITNSIAPQVLQTLKLGNIIRSMASGLGIPNVNDFVMTEDEIQQMNQQIQEQQAAQAQADAQASAPTPK